jgi:hypothetical protein
MAINTSGKTVGLSIQPASDLNPGLLNRITGANKVLVTAPDGKSVIQVDPSTIIAGGGSTATIPAVDAVLTSNDSLSGTTARDGVTLTAGTSRVLATGQTTTSQNGLWLVQAGAWTRPIDYSTDALVSSATGQPIYVKSGTTGADTAWYQKSGTTLAGAKLFSRSLIAKIAPIRAVQVRKLATLYTDPWVYDNAAGTWTEPYVVGGLGGSVWSVFDDIVPVLGDRVEVRFGTGSQLSNSTVSNGIFVVTNLGSGSTKAVLTRAPDFAQILSTTVTGVAYEVYDGLRFKSTRRQLTTQGIVTIGTTPMQFEAVERLDPTIIDASQAPWHIVNTTTGDPYAYNDQSDALNALLYAYRNGPNVFVKLPQGTIPLAKPLHHYGYVALNGAGQDQTSLSSLHNGPLLVNQIFQPGGADDYPTVGLTVDSYANATSLSSWKNNLGSAGAASFFYALDCQSLLIDDWTQFSCEMLIRFESLGTLSPLSHIISCRGRRTNADTDDYGPTAFEGCPFSIIINESATPKTITASMRLTDTTKGVYGATVHTGSGTGTIVGNASVKPTEDAPNLTIRIEQPFTAGVAGGYVSWSVDGKRFYAPVPLGTATSLVISNDVNAFDQPFTAKVDLSGSFLKGDTYKVPCTGVNQNVSLTSATSLAINTNYHVCLQFRSNKMWLYVSPVGGALDSGASATTGVACTGVVRQRGWENTVMGAPCNASVFVAGSDYNVFRGWYGSLAIRATSVVAPTSVPTTLYDGTGFGVTGDKLRWVPRTDALQLDAAGTNRRAWQASTEPGIAPTWMIPRSTQGYAQPGGGLQNLTLQLGNSQYNRGTGIVSTSWGNRTLRNLAFQGGLRGLVTIGPDFDSIIENVIWQVKWGPSLMFFQGNLVMTGKHLFANSLSRAQMIVSTTSLVQSGGSIFFNIDQVNQTPMLLSEMENTTLGYWFADAENLQQNPCNYSLIRVSVLTGNTFKLAGNAFTIETYSTLAQVAGQGQLGTVAFDNFNFTSAGRTLSNVIIGNTPQLVSLASVGYTPVPIILGAQVGELNPTGWDLPTNAIAGMTQRQGTADVQLLTSGTQSIVWQRGVALRLKANTLGANSTYTIGVVGARPGDIQEILVEPQAGFTTTIANGGSAGAAGIYVNPVTAVAMKDRHRLRLDDTFNWVAQ